MSGNKRSGAAFDRPMRVSEVPGYTVPPYIPVFFIVCLVCTFIGIMNGFAAEAESTTICFRSNCVTAQIADSSEERMRGLMYRQQLLPEEAMLFVFDHPDRHGFWMKNMNFPIDIIWLDERKEIVDIRERCPPCLRQACEVMVPVRQATYVIEVEAGFVAAHGVSTGETVNFQLPHPRS